MLKVDIGFFKTRWNSLRAMLGRILEIKPSISKAFIDCNQELGTFDLENQEVDAIHHIVLSLEPVKLGTECIFWVHSERIGAIK